MGKDTNIKKIFKLVQKDLKKEWKKITFDYSLTAEKMEVTADLTLNNHDDDITVIITAYPGGGAAFRAVFDKIEKTPRVLELLNDFNDDGVFFKAFVREDGYLELSHFFICYEESMFKSYASEFLIRLADMADNEILQEITQYTHD